MTEDRFIGRTRSEGVRSGLRSLATYIADNPREGFPGIGVGEVRGFFREVIGLLPVAEP